MKNKWKIILLSLLVGVLMGFLAYHFVPRATHDLVRHFRVVDALAPVSSVEDFFRASEDIDREFIPRVYSLVIAKIGNHNLLQTFVAFFGYSSLCYILFDYRNKVKMKNSSFFFLLLLILFGQPMIYYFSGLYNYLAINLFALATYFDYYKDKKKIALVLYFLTPFIHSSMILPLAVTLFLKIKKGKISKSFLAIFGLVMLFFGVFMGFIVDLLNWDFLISIKTVYDNYVASNDRMMDLYDGFYLFMSITKVLLALSACWLCSGSDENKKVRNLIYLMTVTVIVLSISSIAFTRFSSLILFISIPIIVDVASKKNRQSQLIRLSILALSILYIIYTIYTISPFIIFG